MTPLIIQYQSAEQWGGHPVDPARVFADCLGKLRECDVWFHVGEEVEFAGILLRREGKTFWDSTGAGRRGRTK